MIAIDTTITDAIADVIKDRLSVNGSYMVGNGHDKMVARNEGVQIALNLARELADSSCNFNPLTFLDSCSPDTEHYPLSELWETVN